MAKLTNEQICEKLYEDKGLEMDPANPNLVKVARSLGILTDPLHVARIVHYAKGTGEVTEPTDKSKAYVAITGGARGREAWFALSGEKTPIEHAMAIREACDDLVAELTEPDSE